MDRRLIVKDSLTLFKSFRLTEFQEVLRIEVISIGADRSSSALSCARSQAVEGDGDSVGRTSVRWSLMGNSSLTEGAAE